MTVLINLGGYQPTGAEFFGTAYFELAILPPAPPAVGTLRLRVPLPLHLPDPRVICYHSAQKRCIFPDGRPVQMSKGVFGYYP